MNAAAPHRAGVTALIGLAAVLVVGALIVGSGFLERLMLRLPEVPGVERIALALSAIAVLAAVIWMFVRLGELGRARARRRALEATVRGEVSCGIRSRLLRLEPQRAARMTPARRSSPPASRSWSTSSACRSGMAGAARAARCYFPWREVRNIRSDSLVVGNTVVSVLVLRARHGGTSVELPIILAAERPGRFALADAPFFAVVRSWKAKHRAALAAEGLELPPLTAPIPIIPPGQVLASR